jgi:hypothetical protein
MANLHRDIVVNDVDQALASLNRGRNVKLALAIAIIIGTFIGALLFAQFGSSVP